ERSFVASCLCRNARHRPYRVERHQCTAAGFRMVDWGYSDVMQHTVHAGANHYRRRREQCDVRKPEETVLRQIPLFIHYQLDLEFGLQQLSRTAGHADAASMAWRFLRHVLPLVTHFG